MAAAALQRKTNAKVRTMRSPCSLRSAAATAALYLACGAAATQQPSPNAAPLYRRAFVEMDRALQSKTGDPVDYPEFDLADVATFRSAPWPELIEKTAVARTLFAQAAVHERCVFDEPSSETLIRDEITDRRRDFLTARTFIIAHAFSVVTARPDAAIADAETLLAAAQHVEQQGSVFSMLMASNLAGGALLICEAVLNLRGASELQLASLRRALKAVEARQRGCSPRRLADLAVADARILLTALNEPAMKNTAAIQAARARAIEMIDAFVEPLRTARAGDADKLRAATEAASTALKAKFDNKRATDILQDGVGEALAAAMATMVAPNSMGLFQAWEEHHQQLDRVASALRARCGVEDASKQR